MANSDSTTAPQKKINLQNVVQQQHSKPPLILFNNPYFLQKKPQNHQP